MTDKSEKITQQSNGAAQPRRKQFHVAATATADQSHNSFWWKREAACWHTPSKRRNSSRLHAEHALIKRLHTDRRRHNQNAHICQNYTSSPRHIVSQTVWSRSRFYIRPWQKICSALIHNDCYPFLFFCYELWTRQVQRNMSCFANKY